jgi:hypothetical protein
MSGEEGNIFTCASCGHKVCILHENTWHEGETCEEYDYRSSGRKERDQRAQEAASLEAIGKFSKKCPNIECVYHIEKNDGCDHMTCKFECPVRNDCQGAVLISFKAPSAVTSFAGYVCASTTRSEVRAIRLMWRVVNIIQRGYDDGSVLSTSVLRCRGFKTMKNIYRHISVL